MPDTVEEYKKEILSLCPNLLNVLVNVWKDTLLSRQAKRYIVTWAKDSLLGKKLIIKVGEGVYTFPDNLSKTQANEILLDCLVAKQRYLPEKEEDIKAQIELLEARLEDMTSLKVDSLEVGSIYLCTNAGTNAVHGYLVFRDSAHDTTVMCSTGSVIFRTNNRDFINNKFKELKLKLEVYKEIKLDAFIGIFK